MSFNGAAAAKPRKPRVAMHSLSASRPFNGAAAAKPRKRLCGLVPLLPRHPSMEPRLRSRGSERAADYQSGYGSLQWSRGCEAAEATLRWRPLDETKPKATFNGAAAAKPRKRECALARPRCS